MARAMAGGGGVIPLFKSAPKPEVDNQPDYCFRTMSDSPALKPQIALVGAHSDGFVKALQGGSFDVEQCNSIPDVSWP